MVAIASNALNITQTGIQTFDGTNAFTGSTVTQHGVLLGGASNAVSTLALDASTTKVLVSGGAAADPSWQSVSAAGGITTITGNSGGAESPSTGNFNVLGTGSITVAGSANTETVQLTGLTNHAVLVGAGTATITNVGPTATALQILQSAGAAADPVFSTATYPATTTVSQVLYSSSTNVVGGLATANNGLLVTSNTGVPSILAGPGTTGNILQSNAAAAPSFSTATYPSTTTINQILYSSSTNVVGGITAVIDGVLISNHAAGLPSFLANGTAGFVLTAQSGAPPAWAANTSLSWAVITANQTAVVNNGYICNKAGTLALALPASGAIGDIIEVTGINTATGWQITQAANQQIFYGTSSTTLGATGTLTSSAIRDSLRMVCVVAGASTVWNVISSVGNITVV